MSNIVEVMRSLPYFYPAQGASPTSISAAEGRLGLGFTAEYREYLEAFGDASANGHEITGVTDNARIDVVAVTLAERVRNPQVPADFYVVEQTGIDRIVVWQDSSGFVYQTVPGGEPEKIYDTLSEYMAS